MAEDKIIGINQDKLEKLILDSYDSIEKISSKLNNISSQINEVTKYLDEDNAKILVKKFNDQKEEFGMLKKGLTMMNDRLIKAKNSYNKINSDLEIQISEDINKIRNKEVVNLWK